MAPVHRPLTLSLSNKILSLFSQEKAVRDKTCFKFRKNIFKNIGLLRLLFNTIYFSDELDSDISDYTLFHIFLR